MYIKYITLSLIILLAACAKVDNVKSNQEEECEQETDVLERNPYLKECED